MKTCPTCQNKFVDDTYNFCLEDGSLLVGLEEPEVETVISHKKIKIDSTVNNGIANLIEPIIAINISQQYPYVKNDDELYDVTRSLWRLSRKRAEKADYAMAVFQGEVKEIYQIECWKPSCPDSINYWVNRKSEQGNEQDPKILEGRFQFLGQVAAESIKMKYMGKQIPKPHGQNPIRYFNC